MANARRLLAAAEVMFEKSDYSLATSLAILSIEESGKIPILRGLSVARNEKEISSCWKNYRSHIGKNKLWVAPYLFRKGARKLTDLKILVDDKADHPYVLEHIKQLGLYSDCLGKAHWSEPCKVIEKNMAASIIKNSRSFLTDKLFTELEIELWIKHMGPVWGSTQELININIVKWYAEMQERGLASNIENAMAQSLF